MLGPSLHSLRHHAERGSFSVEYTSRLLAVAKRLESAKVPTIFSLMHFARLSNTSWEKLRDIVRRDCDEYRVFTIRKRSGGNRLICAPSLPLRRAQVWIDRNILRSPGGLGLLHDASTAYAPSCSILKNASMHAGAAWIIKIDIKDFFESISERQVYHVFRRLGYPALLSFEFSRMCTRIVPRRNGPYLRKREKMWRWSNHDTDSGGPYTLLERVGHLPQGAPTSAMLANLVVTNLDEKIQGIACGYEAVYSRYADDIVLSLGRSTRSECSAIFSKIVKEISLAGFRVNRKKSHISGPGSRKVVTGLIANDQSPRLPRSTKDQIMTSLYHIRKHGLLSHMTYHHSDSPLGYLNHLVGRILFARSIEKDFGTRAMQELRDVMAPYQDLVRMAQILGSIGDNINEFENLHRLIFHNS